MSENHISPKPFLKWAGGKRWFVDLYSNLLPTNFNKYHEPFLGGGSVFFHLTPTSAVLSDLNADLINTYTAIKSDFSKVERRLMFHNRKHTKEHYYKVRAGIEGSAYSKAGDFIYLNRTCWNGLYRVNRQGKFNVPIGDRASILRTDDDFNSISNSLSDVELKVSCFSEALKSVGENDFCFIDPPYTVKHNTNGFIRYNETIFSWENQIALRDAVIGIKNMGGKALILNANHDSIVNLYKGVGRIIPLQRKTMLAASSMHRGVIEEVAIIVGYDI